MERKPQIEAAENIRWAILLRFAYPAQSDEDADERSIVLHEWTRIAAGLPEDGEVGADGVTYRNRPGVTYVRTGEQFRAALAAEADTPQDRAALGLPQEG